MVIDAAVSVLADEGRLDAVGLRPVAERLGVRVQSLYAHVDGADGLRRALALRGLDALADRLTTAAIGRAGSDAVAAIVRAYCGFATDEPGLYDATLLSPEGDPELSRAMATVTRPLNLVFESAGLSETESVHWYRIVYSAVHGFSTLRRDGQLTLDADPDETIERMIAMFTRQLGLDTDSGVRPRGGRRSPRR